MHAGERPPDIAINRNHGVSPVTFLTSSTELSQPETLLAPNAEIIAQPFKISILAS